MKSVRFKTKYAGTFEQGSRISYELVDDGKILSWHSGFEMTIPHYNTKLLGLIPSYMMEDADGSEIPALEILIKTKQ